jgi:hypothetical protein
MTGIPIVSKGGPRTFTPASGEAIRGGVLIEARAAGRVGVAAAGSFVVLGVATNDAQAPEQLITTPTVDAFGRNVLSAAQFPTTVAVVYGAAEVPVTYAANATFGQKLVAAAAGTVTPAGAAADARTIVGVCTEPLGVVVGTNPVGLMRTV